LNRILTEKRGRAITATAVVLSVGAVGAAFAVVGSASAAPTATMPSTVQFGTQTVKVPPSGIVTVDGQSVQVGPGAKRIFLVTPPAGSGSGPTGPTLPPGATGEVFTFPAPTSTTTTVPATAVYANAAPVAPDAAELGCELDPLKPTQPGGTKSARGLVNVKNAPGDVCTDVIRNTLTATLYSGPQSPPLKRGSHTETFSGQGSSTVTTACSQQNQEWHTRGDLTSTDTQNGDVEKGFENSNDALLHC
jgi:hypothetical protein